MNLKGGNFIAIYHNSLKKTNSQKSCMKAFTGSVGSNSSKIMNLGVRSSHSGVHLYTGISNEKSINIFLSKT